MCNQCLLDPTMDFIFKRIFGNEKEPEILICFLNAILEPYSFHKPYSPIVSVEMKNTEITKKSIEDKYSVLDVKATTSNGEIIDIEIQREDTTDMLRRSMFYLDEMFTEQLESGYQYDKLNRVVSIVIMNYTSKFIKNNNFHNVYRFQNIATGEELTDLQELHYIELDKMVSFDQDDVLQLFLQFLKDPNDDVVQHKSTKIKELSKAKEKLSKLSRDPALREEFNAREKALKDKASMLAEAEAKGLEKGREEGREEGVAIGVEQGVAIGVEQGVAIGVEQGVAIGVEQGVELEKINAIIRAMNKCRSKEFIFEEYECSAEQYEKALQEFQRRQF